MPLFMVQLIHWSYLDFKDLFVSLLECSFLKFLSNFLTPHNQKDFLIWSCHVAFDCIILGSRLVLLALYSHWAPSPPRLFFLPVLISFLETGRTQKKCSSFCSSFLNYLEKVSACVSCLNIPAILCMPASFYSRNHKL